MFDLGYEKDFFSVHYFMADYPGYPCPKSRTCIKRWWRQRMGAIIGSLYAMGYSPDDMVELLKSEDFKRWYSGEVEEKYVYHFKKNLPTPEFFNIRFSFKDSLKSLKPQFL